ISISWGQGNMASGASELFLVVPASITWPVVVNALYSNHGRDNTASGTNSLQRNNTANGSDALFNNTTGSNNLALGYGAELNLTIGSNNVMIGANVLGTARDA